VMDPQLRLLLEAAVGALQHAGHDPHTFRGPIGMFAGAGASGYLQDHVRPNRELLESVGVLQASIANALDSLASLVSYKLNLTGPSLTVQTACSTSLVAVHLACQSLLSGECDMALAGGVSVKASPVPGYLHQEGSIFSKDGHTRAFDAQASGTVMGNGVGLVVLRRLEDALADGDFIHAVILGSAVNNDGAAKGGYTAPSVTGHARVVSEALGMARVSPRSIGYVEAHGTGTPVGDPIEVEGLTKAFREGTADRGFCSLGSVKTNLGHLDHAAGVAGLIKTVLALRHRKIPPSLHFEEPNPRIDFASSPFRVSTRLSEWPASGGPRRAGVSALGIGGTNAHVVLQEFADRPREAEAPGPHLLRLSARSESALEIATDRLASHLRLHPEDSLADIAHTLTVGRPRFSCRRTVVGQEALELAARLESRDPASVSTGLEQTASVSCAFVFPGQGAQHTGMGKTLHRHFPVFRNELDRCAELLEPHIGGDLRDVLFAPNGEDLHETRLTQPALFVIEYALARLWMSLGAVPRVLLGHSVGEYVAATLAGVFRVEDALALVALRGRLMQAQPRGAMLAVPLSAAEATEYFSERLTIAAVNAPGSCVVSGEEGNVAALATSLRARGVEGHRLQTSHAFHSAMMDDVVEPFAEAVSRVALGTPTLPFVSNVTGDWITADDARDPRYWARHLRATVRFAEGVGRILEEVPLAVLEVGPGHALAGLVRQHPARGGGHTILSSLPRKEEAADEPSHLLRTAGRLWVAGVPMRNVASPSGARPGRVPLPTYPFDRARYWVDRPAKREGSRTASPPAVLERQATATSWLYRPAWRAEATETPVAAPKAQGRWFVLGGESGFGAKVVDRLRARGHAVELGLPRAAAGALETARVLHLGSLGANDTSPWDSGFHSVRQLATALESLADVHVRLHVVTTGAATLGASDLLDPAKAALPALGTVLGQELPGVACGVVDVIVPSPGSDAEALLLDQLEEELQRETVAAFVAYRASLRFTPDVEPVHKGPVAKAPGEPVVPAGGVYLITGGLGRVGLTLARALAMRAPVRLALLGRTGFPPRSEWTSIAPAGGLFAERLRAVEAIEALGSEVLVIGADVADAAALTRAVESVRARLGPIRGVIHAAGILDVGAWRPLRELSREECERQFRPKVKALDALDEALASEAPEFVMLLSSLSTVLGGAGYGAYAAANAYMDAFAERQHARGRRHWMSVDWDAFAAPGGQGGEGSARSELARLALDPTEAGDAFLQVLALGRAARLFVSTADLRERIARSRRLAVNAAPSSAANPSGEASVESTRHHPRPNLLNAYLAPETDTERRLARIWGEQLGLDRVGLHDNFFELGGTSLTAVQMMPRVRTAFAVELEVASLFEGPTVHSMSRMIDERAVLGGALEPVTTATGGSTE
ncbi:MAG TPA: SDR family NAD(P)-dependent oxidoreductase, partial [Vicinamibacteria bacterium]|nr:SDR family NAD(P)-dependent oxidoreductase [Vicinamibacteria bacterium]